MNAETGRRTAETMRRARLAITLGAGYVPTEAPANLYLDPSCAACGHMGALNSREHIEHHRAAIAAARIFASRVVRSRIRELEDAERRAERRAHKAVA